MTAIRLQRAKNAPWSAHLAYLILFLIAFAVRAAFVVVQLRLGIFDVSFEAADSALYRSLADSLSTTGAFALDGAPTAFVTPGYSLFLSIAYLISRSTLGIGLIQAGLGALTVVLLAAVARSIGGNFAAGVTRLMAAIYPHLIFWTGYVLTETLYVFLLAAALYACTRTLEARQSLWRAAVAGALFGAAALVRPLALGFAVLLGVAGVLSARYRTRAFVGLAGLAIVLVPWVIRNAVVLDSPVVTSTEAGFVLWQGNSPGATGGTRGYVDGLDFDVLELPADISEVEADRVYREQALSWMAEHPARVLSLIPKKLWNMWRPTYEGSSTLNSLVTYTSYLPLLVLAIPGLGLCSRRGAMGGILVGFVLYHLVAHGLVTGMIRFRLPVEAMLIIPAGLAVSRIGRRLGVNL